MRNLGIALLISVMATGPGMAECNRGLGCTDEDVFEEADLADLRCSQLWELRNVMYAEAGYCFKTKRAINFFGNDECEIDDQADVELSEIELDNVATIVEVERDKGCR